MLKRKYRLGKKIRLSYTSEFSSPFFTMKTSRNRLSYNRYRIVVSKNTEKKAVVRNSVKRILSSCLEEIQEKIATGFDIVFIIKKDALSKTREDIRQEIERAFKIKGLLT